MVTGGPTGLSAGEVLCLVRFDSAMASSMHERILMINRDAFVVGPAEHFNVLFEI